MSIDAPLVPATVAPSASRGRWRGRAATAVVGASLLAVAACGSTSDVTNSAGGIGSSSTAVSSLCAGTTAKPGYTSTIQDLSGGAGSLSGAGSTFVAPMLSVWTSQYNTQKGVQVAYQSIGSGGGIAQLEAGTVDFGDSDAYMTDTDIAKAKGPVVQIPLVLAPVVVTYNLPGIKSGVTFDGETLGKIFSGQITNWSDPAIARLNSGTPLPSLPIAVVHRSDGSGTTDIWTDYLTRESSSWVSALGGATKSRGKTVAWPVGIGGKGNEGVSGAVTQTQGAIGYVELGYALAQSLPYGSVKNKAGNSIEPCIATVARASQGVTFPDDLRFDLTDSANPDAYPITGCTWTLIYRNQTNAAKAAALVNFFNWVVSSGQDLTIAQNYTPLGADLQSKAVNQLRKLTLNGSPLVK